MRAALASLLLLLTARGVVAQPVAPGVPRLVVGPTIEMEKFVVAATLASIVVRTNYESRNGDEPKLVRVLVEEVRSDSRAARAGIQRGMQILAIEDIPIRGLNDKDFAEVMKLEITGSLTLTVRRRSGFRSFKITIPLGQSTEVKN